MVPRLKLFSYRESFLFQRRNTIELGKVKVTVQIRSLWCVHHDRMHADSPQRATEFREMQAARACCHGVSGLGIVEYISTRDASPRSTTHRKAPSDIDSIYKLQPRLEQTLPGTRLN
jgi:hypothetical protein